MLEMEGEREVEGERVGEGEEEAEPRAPLAVACCSRDPVPVGVGEGVVTGREAEGVPERGGERLEPALGLPGLLALALALPLGAPLPEGRAEALAVLLSVAEGLSEAAPEGEREALPCPLPVAAR